MQHWVAMNDLELSVQHKLVAADKIIKDPLKKSLRIAIIFFEFFLNLDLEVKTYVKTCLCHKMLIFSYFFSPRLNDIVQLDDEKFRLWNWLRVFIMPHF